MSRPATLLIVVCPGVTLSESLTPRNMVSGPERCLVCTQSPLPEPPAHASLAFPKRTALDPQPTAAWLLGRIPQGSLMWNLPCKETDPSPHSEGKLLPQFPHLYNRPNPRTPFWGML